MKRLSGSWLKWWIVTHGDGETGFLLVRLAAEYWSHDAYCISWTILFLASSRLLSPSGFIVLCFFRI